MPANTPKGFPYPLGTDRVTDGDDAIHNLATAIDTRVGVIAAGLVSVPVSSGQSLGSVAVTFPAGRFSAVPVVNGTFNGTNVAWSGVNISSITAAGCTVGVSHRDGTPSGTTTAFTVAWHAIQLP